jgi:hypothetical protein
VKFKKCCLNKLPTAVREKDAKAYKEMMKKPDLVFVTQNNENKILQDAKTYKDVLDEQRAAELLK